MPDSSEPIKTYLLDDIEVVHTGRTAKRKLKKERIDERVEVKPANSAEGTWTRWVRETDLYEIE